LKYVFGARSAARLSECHDGLELIARRALGYSICDFSILCGHRSEEDQTRAFAEGKSKLRFPRSLHNRTPSMALDFGAYPRPFGAERADTARYYAIAQAFFAAAVELGLTIRWGGDWNGNGDFRDNTFNDLGHIELLGQEE
jgi:peptidoglycan L-alanyl-D-glutamate endopeptidase CwlK